MSKFDVFFDPEYMLEGFDFSTVSFMDMLCRFDQGVLIPDIIDSAVNPVAVAP